MSVTFSWGLGVDKFFVNLSNHVAVVANLVRTLAEFISSLCVVTHQEHHIQFFVSKPPMTAQVCWVT